MGKTKILVAREYYGLGDWLMMFTCIHVILKNHPHVSIDIDVTNIPLFLLKLTSIFDVEITCVNNPDENDYQFKIMPWTYPQVRIYENLADSTFNQILAIPLHLIEGMLLTSQFFTGLKNIWDQTLVKTKPIKSSLELPPKYIIIPSCGKRMYPNKDWSVENFEQLALRLKGIYKIVQVGLSSDPKLANADLHFFDLEPLDLAFLIKNATLVVSLDNSLYHFSAIFNTKACVLFFDIEGPYGEHSKYKNQLHIAKPTIEVDEVFNACHKLLNNKISSLCI